MELIDEDGVPYEPFVGPGLYKINIEASERLVETTPSIEIFSSGGYNETAGEAR